MTTIFAKNSYSLALLLIIAASISLLNIIFTYYGITFPHANIHHEDQLLEWSQVFYLAISMIVLLACIKFSIDHYRIIYGIGALFCFSFLLREIDIEDQAVPDVLIFLGSGIARNIILASMWLAAIIVFFLRPRVNLYKCWAFCFSVPGYIFILAAVFLFFGAFFDKQIINIEHNSLYEELLETFGYGFACIASIACLLLPNKP